MIRDRVTARLGALIGSAALAAALLAPTSAAAQLFSDDSTSGSTLSSTSTSTTSTAVSVGGVVITLVMMTPEENRRNAQLARYLMHNASQVRQDLAMGAGPSVRDLASAFHVKHDDQRRFGALLRAHRAELSTLISDGSETRALRIARADRFARLVHAAMRQDLTLIHAARALERAQTAH